MKKILFALTIGAFLVSFTGADTLNGKEKESKLIFALIKTKVLGHVKASGEVVLDGIKLPESAMISGEKYSFSEPKFISSKSDCGNFVSFIATSQESGNQILFATTVLTNENLNCRAISHLCKAEKGFPCEFDFKDGTISGCKNENPEQYSDHTIADGKLVGQVGDLLDIIVKSTKDF